MAAQNTLHVFFCQIFNLLLRLKNASLTDSARYPKEKPFPGLSPPLSLERRHFRWRSLHLCPGRDGRHLHDLPQILADDQTESQGVVDLLSKF
jgi:hypothetical protein